jgi:pSer/pThr/pTyr-binding forkhead associated (FHA) protein
MIGEIKQIRILAAAPEVETQIGTDGVIVKKLPFRVGRRKDPGETGRAAQANLALNAPGSGQLARQHFALEDRDGRLVVRDLESDLGTLVNGRRIAGFERSDVADLNFGDNKIQAGGSESPYRFHVIVERKSV